MVTYKYMIKLKLFIGTSIHSKRKGSYSIQAYNKDTYLVLPPKIIEQTYISHCVLTLRGLYDFLLLLSNTSKDEGIAVCLYTTDNIVSYEWNTEYIKDGSFSLSNQNVEIWNKIINILKSTNITLDIKGDDNCLSAISKVRSNYGKKFRRINK